MQSPNLTLVERMFINSFLELGLTQCINDPTHFKGNTLDLLLTNYTQLVTNLKILNQNSVCKSDHYPISFKVKTKIKFKKPVKRKIYNFKRANWEELNTELCRVNWTALLDCIEPEIAWSNFKTVLFHLVNKHIPIITIKSEYQPPWYDSEVHDANRAKNRIHKNWKTSKSDEDYFKFEGARKIYKNLACQKMRDNLYNSDDPALITKKFWSHYKASKKSPMLPECMTYRGQFRNDPLEKANLFNDFFYEQFSDRSTYNIDINWNNDDLFEISFHHD